MLTLSEQSPDENVDRTDFEYRRETVKLSQLQHLDAVAFLAQKCNSWIVNEQEKLDVFWKPGTLFRHVRVLRDDRGRIIRKLDGRLVIALTGKPDNDDYFGLSIVACEEVGGMKKAEALVSKKSALFVVHPESAEVEAIEEFPESTVFYSHPILDEVHVTSLRFEIFDESDHYGKWTQVRFARLYRPLKT